MKKKSPFLPGFAKLLFGRRKARPLEALERSLAELRDSPAARLGQLLVGWLPADAFALKRSSGANSRHRQFTVHTTFWGFLWQVLTPGSSCRQVVQRLRACGQLGGGGEMEGTTSAYCQARARLPLRFLFRLGQQLADEALRRTPADWLWCGRTVKVVDGTGVSMPDTADNQRQWPQPTGQKRGCGFPVAGLAGLFCLHSGALLHTAKATRKAHESPLWRRLWRFLSPGDVVLGDRAYCSYASMVLLRERRRVDTVFRQHQRRRTDFRKGKRLGPGDRLVTVPRPKARPKSWDGTTWGSLPAEFPMRMVRVECRIPGHRVERLVLLTTLLDPARYPAEELALLYLRRWRIELFFRDIKTTMRMDVLRCKTPHMVARELAMHQIAYNMVRLLMQESALEHDLEAERLSFKGSLDALGDYGRALDGPRAPGRKEVEKVRAALTEAIAADPLPERPGRREPRAKKRRPKNFPLLTSPRHEYVEAAHRSNYRKAS